MDLKRLSATLHIWIDLISTAILEDLSMWTLYLCTDPELDEEECIVWPFFVQLLQASFFLRELVVDLPHIYGFQHWVVVTGVRGADVYKKVFILQGGRRRW